jgi:hypothetical protein
MRSIIHAFSLPMLVIISFGGYCLLKYADGTDKLSKANSLCSMNYTVGNWMDSELFGKFDPTVGAWTNTAWQYIGQGCFYTVSHINGAFDSKIKWSQTQLFNTSEHPLLAPLALQPNIPQNTSQNPRSQNMNRYSNGLDATGGNTPREINEDE